MATTKVTGSTRARKTTRAGEPIVLAGMDSPSNDAADIIAVSAPYTVRVTIEGTTALLWHRWSCDAVAAKSSAAKGSAAKKSDDVESYVWRNGKGNLSLPGEYLRQSILTAAKFRQDPRSPRKSAMDLFKAAIVAQTELADLGVSVWDYIDRRRVMVQRAAITRERPGTADGWRATVDLTVLLGEYISPRLLREVLDDAGRLVGVGDFRPTFGRFVVVAFKVITGGAN